MSGVQGDGAVMSEEDITIIDSVVINSKPVVPKTRKRNLTSVVWADFKLVEQDDGFEKAVCNDCGQKYAYDSQKGGTSTMSRHKCARRETQDVGQLLLSGKNGQMSTRARKIDQMKFRELVSKMIIKRNLPLSLVEWEEFREICTYLNDDVKSFSRNTEKADILKAHATRKEAIRKRLKCLPGRISLTSDMWTSVTTTGYISLTVHYIDEDWKLQKKLLNFSPLPPPHSGEALSAKLFSMLEDWGIEEKVCNITLDNAASNIRCIKVMKSRLVAKKIVFGKGKYFHVRCCAHILALIVKDGLTKIDPAVIKVRKLVKYIKGSQIRKQTFFETVETLGLSVRMGLRRDVKTRWNSTYLMLQSCIAFEKVFTHLKLMDSDYEDSPTEEEWFQIKVVTKFLKAFYDLTTLFSGIVLDPRLKLAFVKFTYQKLYPDESELKKNVDLVRSRMTALYKEYFKASNSRASTSNGTRDAAGTLNNENSAAPLRTMHMQEFAAAQESGGLQSDKSELDQYLSESTLPPTQNLDILQYWKAQEQRYPVLSRMAGDILAVPISTVASESAFSIGGRVIDRFRSSLSPETAEALITTRDWDYGVGKWRKSCM
ncbi:hypothetical protein MKW92_051298 [Papaver armeniacum]|nr:hypothetical protein MKW92_051298 [Papaver armeniacum]